MEFESTKPILTDSSAASTDHRSRSDNQPGPTPQGEQAESSGLAETRAAPHERLRDHVRDRTPDKALRIHRSLEPAGRSAQANAKLRDSAHAAKEIARGAARQREDDLVPRLLRRAVERLHTLTIPVYQNAKGEHVVAKDAIPPEEFAVLMRSEMKAQWQIILAGIAERQKRLRRQTPTPDRTSQPKPDQDNSWDLTMKQYQKWRGDRGIG